MDTKAIKKHLKKVILKVDFFVPIDAIDQNIPPKLNTIITKTFPIPEPKELFLQEYKLSYEKLSHTTTKFKEWNYYDGDRKKLFTLTKNGFCLSYDKYKSFADLKKQFTLIVDGLFELYPELTFKRMGLRYINNITGKKSSELSDWSTILNKKLFSIFDIPQKKDKPKITRAFQVLEFSHDEFSLRFQFGMHNPDYPAVMQQKLFTLDFDAYYSGLLTKNDLDEKLTKFHDAIKAMLGRC